MSERHSIIDHAPEYQWIENHHLIKPTSIEEIDMDYSGVVKSGGILHTRGCATCVALIIVATMNDGEIWHGLWHSSQIASSDNINNSFRSMMDDLIDDSEQSIKDIDYYIVINPQYRNYYTQFIQESQYKINVLIPQYNCQELNMSHNIHPAYIGSSDVTLSSGLIEVKYTEPLPYHNYS